MAKTTKKAVSKAAVKAPTKAAAPRITQKTEEITMEQSNTTIATDVVSALMPPVEATTPPVETPPTELPPVEMPTVEPKTADGDETAKLRAMVEALQSQLDKQQSPQVIQVMADTEKVTLRFQSECADDNIASFGPGGMYGQVTGKVGTILVPKAEWSRFMSEQVRYMLDNRSLIILGGLDEAEMELYGCNYREGELLDRNAFMKLLDMGEALMDVFPALCPAHREMVAKRFLSAYENGDSRVQNRGLVVALNELSKSGDYPEKDPRRKGLFLPIIERMNERDAE